MRGDEFGSRGLGAVFPILDKVNRAVTKVKSGPKGRHAKATNVRSGWMFENDGGEVRRTGHHAFLVGPSGLNIFFWNLTQTSGSGYFIAALRALASSIRRPEPDFRFV